MMRYEETTVSGCVNLWVDFVLSELNHTFSIDYKLTADELFVPVKNIDSVICAVESALEQDPNIQTVSFCCEESGVVVLKLKKANAVSGASFKIRAFSRLRESSEYLLTFGEVLKSRCENPVVSLGSTVSQKNIQGFVSRKPQSAKRVAILTPVFERFDLLFLYTKYTLEYLAPMLRWFGFDVIVIFSGGFDEYMCIEQFTKIPNFVYIFHENNLGAKKNELLRLAHSLLCDFVCHIDSDDFFHPKTCVDLIKKAEVNGFWSSIKEFVFVDARTKLHYLFDGYMSGHPLENWGMGSGRVFTTELLDRLPENPFVHRNSSMDFYIREHLQGLEIEPSKRLLSEAPYLPLGLKTKENIWALEKYPIKQIDPEMFRAAWMPQAILSAFLRIPFGE